MRAKMRAFAGIGATAGDRAAGDTLGGKESELPMGADLNSYQRRLCHAIADEYQLGHESRGEGNQRQIYVWRLNGSSTASTSATPAAAELTSAAPCLMISG